MPVASRIQQKLPSCRILIYSHDSYGLGHLRRCHTIAHEIVHRFKGVSVLILTGSPIIGRFEFAARVDFVRVPGVIKLYNGDYTSLALHIDIEQTLAMRKAIIYSTAQSFSPDIFIVDKEPLGLKKEVQSTLEMLKIRQTTTILGLRDVMDSLENLQKEWQKKGIKEQLDKLYDYCWIYGTQAMSDDLTGLEVSKSFQNKCRFTGYLFRGAKQQPETDKVNSSPYLLVTPGGGGDGYQVIDGLLKAYETGQTLPWPAVIVLGPFMPKQQRKKLQQRADRLIEVEMHTFSNQLEKLMQKAKAVVAMGGYNTFCEIISLRRPALIVPRTKPRLEQYIRAERAAKAGLVLVFNPAELADTQLMIKALWKLARHPAPKKQQAEAMLSGLDFICTEVEKIIFQRQPSVKSPL